MQILIVINPNSGTKKAENIFDTIIKPLLCEKKLDYEVAIAKEYGELQNRLQSLDINTTKCIMFISGDGTVFRTMNNLYETTDAFNSLPLIIIPGGTENGIYTSIISYLNYRNVEEYSEKCISAYKNDEKRKMNSFQIELQQNKKKMKVLILISFGFLSEAHFKTERSRNRRMNLYIECMKMLISYSYTNDEYTILYKPVDLDKPVKPFIRDLFVESEDIPEGWKKIVGNFCCVVVSGHSYFGKSAGGVKGFSSFSGTANLYLVSSENRYEKLKYLMTCKDPKFDSFDKIDVIEITAFKIYPPNRKVYLSIDGEQFDEQPVFGECTNTDIYA